MQLFTYVLDTGVSRFDTEHCIDHKTLRSFWGPSRSVGRLELSSTNLTAITKEIKFDIVMMVHFPNMEIIVIFMGI